ncbi:MAG: hypothetical protein R3C11_09835 [Planctomycetaceae bacterium]
MKSLRLFLLPSFIILLITLVFHSRPESITWAGPTTDNPTQLYQARFDEMSQHYWGRSKAAIDIILMVLGKIDAAEASGDIKVVPPREISEAYVMVEELSFCATKLGIYGEPAARHFQLFASDSKGKLLRFIEVYLQIPGVKDQLYSDKSRKGLKKVISDQVKKVKRLQTMIKKQEWQELDEEIHGIYLAVWRYLCWYPEEKVTDPVLVQIFELRTEYSEEITETYKQQADEVLTQLSAELQPQFGFITQELEQAINAISKQGKVKINGTDVSGPEAIKTITEQLKQVQVQAIKLLGVQISHSASNPRVDAEITALQISQPKFLRGSFEQLGKMISADASRVNGIEAETLYGQYLPALNSLSALVEDPELLKPVDQAMLELASKSKDFLADVTTYEDTTGDLLRWRERMASAHVRTQQSGEFATLLDVMKSGNIGKFERTRGDDIDVDVRTWLDDIQTLKTEYVGKQVIIDDLVLSESEQILFTPVKDYYCATADMPAPANLEIGQLIADLQATSTDTIPLTLQAHQAIYTALHNDYYQIGGELVRVEYEGRITQFATCKPGDLARERLTEFEEIPVNNLAALLIRNTTISHVKPEWIRHRYFVSFPKQAP